MNVRIEVPATAANLGPGFDILALALDLHNQVTAQRADTISIDPGPGAAEELYDPEHNLVCRGYVQGCDGLGVPPESRGVHLSCVNRIPMARGLGSSAAAIVAGLLAARALHNPSWDNQNIIELGAAIEGHRDNVAAAVLGGLTICAPETIPQRIDIGDELVAVLFIPDAELPTATARDVVPQTLSRADAIFNAGRIALLVHSLQSHDYSQLAAAMDDRWHQPQRTSLYPALPRLIETALRAGARGAALSGAGPTIIALADHGSAAIEGALEAGAAAAGVAGTTHTYAVLNHGARVAADS